MLQKSLKQKTKISIPKIPPTFVPHAIFIGNIGLIYYRNRLDFFSISRYREITFSSIETVYIKIMCIEIRNWQHSNKERHLEPLTSKLFYCERCSEYFRIILFLQVLFVLCELQNIETIVFQFWTLLYNSLHVAIWRNVYRYFCH